MKKYPYTESTDLIIYDQKPKKEKKQKVWLTAVCSALAASIFTAGVFGTGMYFMQKNMNNNTQSAAVASATTQSDDSSSSDSAQLAAYKNGKKVLTIPEIAEQVGPSVVGVINKTTVQPQKYYDPFSGRYYYSSGDGSTDGQTVEQGSGSGIIFQDDGYIVTNQHVIDGASEISVILNTGDEFTAKLVGQDTKTDLAVLKIDPGSTKLTAATLGDSTTVQVGETAVAIGNPMGQEFSGSVTSGIISAVNRTMNIDNRTYNLLQTDAAINSGNSGGALINQYGEVIGINSVKLSTTGVEGMGFAIPINDVITVAEQIRTNGKVSHPVIGISGVSLNDYSSYELQRYGVKVSVDEGIYVVKVTSDGAASKAGIQQGDVIVKLDGKDITTYKSFLTALYSHKAGDKVKVVVNRSGTEKTIEVTLQEK